MHKHFNIKAKKYNRKQILKIFLLKQSLNHQVFIMDFFLICYFCLLKDMKDQIRVHMSLEITQSDLMGIMIFISSA